MEIFDGVSKFEEEDLLNRGPIASGLVDLVKASKKPLTVCVDGEWGEGKTTFSKKMLLEFRDNNYNIVYFDAFSCDFHDDPLIALLAAVESALPVSKVERDKVRERLSKGAIPFLKSGVRVAVKAATANMVDTKVLEEEYASLLNDGFDELAQSYIKEGMESYSSRAKSIDFLHEEIEKIAFSGAKKGLVFVIDELDRCRPNFAVEIIEKVKHVMSANGAHFFLIMNKDQMKGALSNIYGYSNSVDNYLEKFISHSIRLPKKTSLIGQGVEAETSLVYAKNKCEFQLEGLSSEVSYVSKITGFLCSVNNFNLRKIDRVIDKISLQFLIASDDIEQGLYRSEYDNYRLENYFIPTCVVMVELGGHDIYTPKVLLNLVQRGQGPQFLGEALGREMQAKAYNLSAIKEYVNQLGIRKYFEVLSKTGHTFSGQEAETIVNGHMGQDVTKHLYNVFWKTYCLAKATD